MSEYWDMYDRQLRPLGKTILRNDNMKMPKGEFHIVVNILSVNREGQILITKRHPDKPYGNMWEISGGSVLAGESPTDGAVRELYEETGLKADVSALRYMGQIIRERSGCIHNFYLFEGDFTDKDITLQAGETVDYKLTSAGEIERMSQNGEFLDFAYNRMRAVYGDIFFYHR